MAKRKQPGAAVPPRTGPGLTLEEHDKLQRARSCQKKPTRLWLTLSDKDGLVVDRFALIHYKEDYDEDWGGDDCENYGSSASESLLLSRIKRGLEVAK